MDKKIVSVTQQHINTAISQNNFNGTPSMLACREAGLDSSVSFDNGVAIYLFTNEDEKHPNYGSDPNDKSKLSADCRDGRDMYNCGYIIKHQLQRWMDNYCRNWYKNAKSIKPIDIVLTKNGKYWHADTA